MYDAEFIRQKITNLGADLCGFAPSDRFNDAPSGFHPKDIYKECKTVIVFAKKLPKSSLSALSCVPYTDLSSR